VNTSPARLVYANRGVSLEDWGLDRSMLALAVELLGVLIKMLYVVVKDDKISSQYSLNVQLYLEDSSIEGHGLNRD
jgi:hypothetical protein